MGQPGVWEPEAPGCMRRGLAELGPHCSRQGLRAWAGALGGVVPALFQVLTSRDTHGQRRWPPDALWSCSLWPRNSAPTGEEGELAGPAALQGWGGGCGHVAICLTSRSHMRCHPGQPRYRYPLRSAFCAALTSSPTKTSRKV